MRRYIVLLLITGIVWAQTDFDKLVLKDGTTYFGECSKIEGEIVYFKPQNAFAFQPISIKKIKTLESSYGHFIIAPGLKIDAKNQNKLILKSGATYFGEFSTIDGDNVYFKPKGASDFQSISIKQIQTLELKFGQIVIAPGLKIEAKYQNEFIKNNNNNKKDCLIATIFIIAGVGLIIEGFDLGLNFGGGGSGHPSF